MLDPRAELGIPRAEPTWLTTLVVAYAVFMSAAAREHDLNPVCVLV
jgi:hypothetical protein